MDIWATLFYFFSAIRYGDDIAHQQLIIDLLQYLDEEERAILWVRACSQPRVQRLHVLSAIKPGLKPGVAKKHRWTESLNRISEILVVALVLEVKRELSYVDYATLWSFQNFHLGW